MNKKGINVKQLLKEAAEARLGLAKWLSSSLEPGMKAGVSFECVTQFALVFDKVIEVIESLPESSSSCHVTVTAVPGNAIRITGETASAKEMLKVFIGIVENLLGAAVLILPDVMREDGPAKDGAPISPEELQSFASLVRKIEEALKDGH